MNKSKSKEETLQLVPRIIKRTLRDYYKLYISSYISTNGQP